MSPIASSVICTCALCAKSLGHVWLRATPWTAAHQALCPRDAPGESTEADCHALLQGISPTQGLNPASSTSTRIGGGFFTSSAAGKPGQLCTQTQNCLAPAQSALSHRFRLENGRLHSARTQSSGTNSPPRLAPSLFSLLAKGVQMHQVGFRESFFILPPLRVQSVIGSRQVHGHHLTCLSTVPPAPPPLPGSRRPLGPGLVDQRMLLRVLASDLTPRHFTLPGATGGIWLDWRADQITPLLKVIHRFLIVLGIKSKAFRIACLILHNL